MKQTTKVQADSSHVLKFHSWRVFKIPLQEFQRRHHVLHATIIIVARLKNSLVSQAGRLLLL